MTTEETKNRLEYLRGELRAERISYGELHELQSLAFHIDSGDMELLEAAGVPEDLIPPGGLCENGNCAYQCIMKFLNENQMTHTGGCKAFYSPAAWAERGEKYGLKSLLIVCHDGGDLASIFNLDYGHTKLHDEMWKALEADGLWFEPCTSWYTAIYLMRK